MAETRGTGQEDEMGKARNAGLEDETVETRGAEQDAEAGEPQDREQPVETRGAGQDAEAGEPQALERPAAPIPDDLTFVGGDLAWWESPGGGSRMTRSFSRDVWRTVHASRRRFLSILLITLLGVTMLVGIRAACIDLRMSADAFFDAQNLRDISIQSTLGLTDEDVSAIAELEGVQTAEGIYTETAYTTMGSARERVSVQSLSGVNMDVPLVEEGTLPEAPGEVAVTARYLRDSGKKLGDTVSFSASADGAAQADGTAQASGTSQTAEAQADGEQQPAGTTSAAPASAATNTSTTEIFATTPYTITAVVRDPADVMASSTTNAFRSNGAPSYTFFVAPSAATAQAYTAIHVTVDGASALDSYSQAYTDKVDAVKTRIEDIRATREQAREQQIKDDAAKQIEQGQNGASMVFALMQQKIDRMPAGSAERAQAEADLASQRAAVDEQISEAQRTIDTLGEAVWYVQDRTAIPSFSSVDSDASSIEVIGTIFPAIFFIVAVLISLTTATRMVEEERGLIGLYKALGYARGRILSKYLYYSLTACLVGGVLGDLLGFFALPRFLLWVFQAMYDVPRWVLHVDMAWAIGAVALFAVGVGGACALACMAELREVPAVLMRPKAPRAGARILLERLGPIWRHLGFLNKVTARNLFRYKKRAFMTIFGIAGCTALVICGFGINDTVTSLSAKQYGQVTRYDLMAAASDADFPAALAKLEARQAAEGGGQAAAQGAASASGSTPASVTAIQQIRMDTVTVELNGKKESVQLVVVPAGGSLTDYVELRDDAGHAVDLPQDGAVLTKSAGMVLGAGTGSSVRVQDSALNTADVRVTGVALSYLGNNLFMTQAAYEKAFGQAFKPNAVYATLQGGSDAQIALANDIKADGWTAVTSTSELERDFNKNFVLVNAVAVFITGMAAGLAFVVVFTLSNTNISERERELATIKVLGFRRREVHRYINRETLALTALGALAGVPLGWAITESFRYILQMPSLYFDVQIEPVSYAIGVALAFAFTLIVNLATNRTLDRIVMVEALKSAE